MTCAALFQAKNLEGGLYGRRFFKKNLGGGLYGKRFSKIKTWDAFYMGNAFWEALFQNKNLGGGLYGMSKAVYMGSACQDKKSGRRFIWEVLFQDKNLVGGLYGKRFSKIKIWEVVYMGALFQDKNLGGGFILDSVTSVLMHDC